MTHAGAHIGVEDRGDEESEHEHAERAGPATNQSEDTRDDPSAEDRSQCLPMASAARGMGSKQINDCIVCIWPNFFGPLIHNLFPVMYLQASLCTRCRYWVHPVNPLRQRGHFGQLYQDLRQSFIISLHNTLYDLHLFSTIAMSY